MNFVLNEQQLHSNWVRQKELRNKSQTVKQKSISLILNVKRLLYFDGYPTRQPETEMIGIHAFVNLVKLSGYKRYCDGPQVITNASSSVVEEWVSHFHMTPVGKESYQVTCLSDKNVVQSGILDTRCNYSKVCTDGTHTVPTVTPTTW